MIDAPLCCSKLLNRLCMELITDQPGHIQEQITAVKLGLHQGLYLGY